MENITFLVWDKRLKSCQFELTHISRAQILVIWLLLNQNWGFNPLLSASSDDATKVCAFWPTSLEFIDCRWHSQSCWDRLRLTASFGSRVSFLKAKGSVTTNLQFPDWKEHKDEEILILVSIKEKQNTEEDKCWT